MNYMYLNKNAKKCMYLGTLLGTIIFIISLIGIYTLCINNLDKYINIFNTVLMILTVVSILNLVISPYFRYKRYKYIITEDKVDVVEGYIFIKREIVPIDRIHKITLERGPIDNIFGLSKVILTTAGGTVTIKFLKLSEAEKISDSLKNKVNELVI